MKLSIIMPVYNASTSLRRSLTSFQQLAAHSNDINLWVIDDCSTDNSYDIINNFANGEKKIKILRNKENIGPGKSRNRALDYITDGYVGFIDSDDEILHDKYYKSFIDGVKKEADFITCNAWIYKNGKNHKRYDFDRLVDNTYEITRKCLRGELDGSVIFSLYSVDLINKYKLRFSEGYYEDIAFAYLAMILSAKRHISTIKSYRKINREGSIVNSVSEVHLQGLLNSCIAVRNAVINFNLHKFPEFQEDYTYGLHGYIAHALILILENGKSDARQIELLEYFRNLIKIKNEIDITIFRSQTNKDKLASFFLESKNKPASVVLNELFTLHKKLFKGDL